MNKVKPTIHDIKPNGGNHSHPGNRSYLKIIKKKKLEYVLADAKERREVIIDVYNTLLPGRFLQKEADGKFSIKDKKSSLAKIKKALSENNARIVDSLKFRGKWPIVKGPRKRQLPSGLKVTREDWVNLAETLKKKSK
jgi:hypothetical protein